MKRIVQAAFFGLFLLSFGAAFAQSAPQKDAEGFEPVNGDMMQKSGESIPAARLVAAAYGFIGAALVVYIVAIARRARRLEEEVEALKKKLQAR